MGLDDVATFRHTVVTTNQGTFTTSGASSFSAPAAKAWGPLQVLNSLESTGTQLPVKPVFDLGSLQDDFKPRLSRLEKKRIAAKRQRERKKCEVSVASQQLAELQARAAELQAQNESLKLRSNVIETLVKTSDDQLRLASLVTHVAESQALLQPTTSGQCTPGLACDLKDLSLAKLGVAEFRELWNRVVRQGKGMCDASADVRDQFAADVMTWMENWALVRGSADYLTLVSLELEHGAPSQPSCDHWCDVARSLELTPQQQQQALVGLEVVRQLLESVVNEQRALCSSLDATSTSGVYPVCPDEPVVDKLASSLCRESFVLDLAAAFLWRQVLSSRQKLSAVLTSYPFFPDAVQLLNGIQELSRRNDMAVESGSASPRRSPSPSPSDSWSS